MNIPVVGEYARYGPLKLQGVLDDLVADGVIRKDQAGLLLLRFRGRVDRRHPLVAVAECDWSDAREPHGKLTLDFLTQWLANRVGMAYHRIDPLSIDVAKVTSIMPYAYAARLGLLPFKITPSEVTIAAAQPHFEDWKRELEPIVKRKITVVLANAKDIQRYLVEFYALARSVKASEAERGRGPTSGVQNLEQLTELGSVGKLDAN